MGKLRLGVVGLGHRGRLMFKLACEGFDFVEPAAACDIVEKNWTEKQWLIDKPMSELFPKTVFYNDYLKMLDEAHLDVVLVETGADIHTDFCCRALEKNINVLSDIPSVASLMEADFLWKAAEKSKAVISTGANPNECRFTRMLRDFYEKGFLGKPYCMEAEYIHWYMPSSDGDIHLHENGDWRRLLTPIRYCTHSLGPLLAILKEDIVRVSCFGTGEHADDYPPGHRMHHDMECAQFQTDSGVVIRLMLNGRCRAKIGCHSYRIFGTEGYVERIDQSGTTPAKIRFNSTKLYSASELTEISGDWMPYEYASNPNAVGHGGMDYALLDHFFKELTEHHAAAIPLREGLRMTLPGIYAEESSRRGGMLLPVRYPWNSDWSTDISALKPERI